jgi:pimeloyl-ACP methyl ester carboxylesterase
MPKTETLVLIPGLNCTGALFAPQIEALSAACRIVVADQQQDDSTEAMAARLLAQVPGRFAVAGLSMGGYVALETLRQAPDRVTHLALLDTSARADTPEAGANRERLIALAESGRFEEVHRTLWPRLVHPDRLEDRDLEAVVLGMMRDTGPDAFVRQERAIMSRRDLRPTLPGIEIPTLVLVGEQDVLTPPELSREIAEAVEWASLVVVPECGHLSTLERPEAVNRALQAWLLQTRNKV